MSDIFTQKDEDDLLYARGIRRELLDKYIDKLDGGVPTDKEEIAAINALLTGLDGNVIKTVSARSKAKEINNDNAYANSVLAILRERAKQKAKAVGVVPTTELLEDDLPIVPGETDVGTHDLRLDDIIEIE